MTYRGLQRLAGGAIALVGTAGTAWSWYTTLARDYFNFAAGTAFPMFIVLGLGLLLSPDYRTERLARGEDLSTLEGTALITPRWWTILVLALLLGFGNHGVLRFFVQ